jgi:hypothetical protein
MERNGRRKAAALASRRHRPGSTTAFRFKDNGSRSWFTPAMIDHQGAHATACTGWLLTGPPPPNPGPVTYLLRRVADRCLANQANPYLEAQQRFPLSKLSWPKRFISQ